MIMHDYFCKFCGHDFEAMSDWDKEEIECPECHKWANRYFKSGCSNCDPIDANWIKTIRDVVDKDSKKPHCIEFLNHPTRENYKAWLKGEGLRHIESGESIRKPPSFDEKSHLEKLNRIRMRKNRIELHT